MTLRNITAGRAVVDGRQAERLTPPVQVSTTPITSFGSVADLRGYSSNSRRMPSSLIVTMTNATVGTLTYVLGDPDGMVAGKLNRTFTQPTSAQGISVAAVQNSLRSASLLINGMNYSTNNGPVQFAQTFQFVDADYDRANIIDIQPTQAERNTAQNPNLLTLSFKEPYELDWNSAFLINVPAGGTVTLTLFIGAASNR
jgi:hypothetical protein